MEWLESVSSLPNLHPALVHFPIVLLVLAAGLDAGSVLVRRWASWNSLASAAYLLGAVSAWATFFSGDHAADELGMVPAAAQAALARHADLAWWLVALSTVVALAKAAQLSGIAAMAVTRRPAFKAASCVLGLGAVAMVGLTADRGGALVYRHGLAVSLSQGPERAASAGATPPETTESPVTIDEDGTLEWVPGAGSSLGGALEWADPAMASKARVVAGDRRPGAMLEVHGRAVLLFSPDYGDLQAEWRVDLSEFEGQVAVVHHFVDTDSFASFTLDTRSGKARLEQVEAGKVAVLDEQAFTPQEDDAASTLAVSSVGSHRKGFVNGDLVVHGHAAARSPGPAGLLLDGEGRVRILEAAMFPL
ncbi:MAG: hypothetical protein Q9Q13_01490 [Acidobacteriota bacterium]|nr:hypothetical protein [Acidobacteriota bacterium]